MYLDIVSIYDLVRFGTNLGLRFGTRPLVFFAPEALRRHSLGISWAHLATVPSHSVIVRIVLMPGHGFQVSQMA